MKFSQLDNNIDIQRMQREIEDQLADTADLDLKVNKTTALKETAPELINMSDGEEIAYDDGTDQWIYRRIGAKLYKWQLTEV